MTLNKQPTPFGGSHVENEIVINHESAFHPLLSCQHLPNVTISLLLPSFPVHHTWTHENRASGAGVQENCRYLRASRSFDFHFQSRTGSWLDRLNPASSGTTTEVFFVVGSLTVLNGGES